MFCFGVILEDALILLISYKFMLTCAIQHCDDVTVFFRYGSDTFVGRKPSNEDRVVEDEDLGVMGRYFAVYGKAPFSQLSLSGTRMGWCHCFLP